MKIIVTGCKGQLGTEIIKQLREGRSEIGPIPEKLMNATVIPVDLPELDISNYKMVDDFIRRQRPDVIINCAAYTNVDGCEVNHDAAFKANALGPRNLAQAAEKTGARLVHVSTDYVFSGRENGGIAQDEATIPGPISAYVSTKPPPGTARRSAPCAPRPSPFPASRLRWRQSSFGGQSDGR